MLPTVDPGRANLLRDPHIQLFSRQASSGPIIEAQNRPVATPMMIFGKDITIQDSRLLRGYFEGSRAGTFTKHLISLALGGMGELNEMHPPPFMDLFPTPNIPARQDQDQWEPYMTTCAQVLQQKPPFLIPTLGYEPAAVCFSNFRGR